MITTVVFDLDDTLYDEIDYCKSGFSAVSEYLSDSQPGVASEQIFEAFWRQFNTGNRAKVFNTALEELQIPYDERFIRELVRIYREHLPKITLPGDSEQILQILSAQYSLALLTDGFLPGQKLKVQALKIEKFFKCIVYTEELGRQHWKPSPVGFEKILTTLKKKAENVVYIADNEKKDFIGPNKLGLKTIQLLRNKRIHTATSDDEIARANIRISDICEIPAILLKI